MKEITIKLPELKDIEFTIECLEEWVHPNDAFALDDEEQEKIVNNILTNLNNGNEWAWCMVKVTGKYNGLSSSDCLGECSYESEKDFVENSEYYEDMKNQVYAHIIDQLENPSVD